MTTFQIIAICVLGAGALAAICLTIAFIVELCTKKKPEAESADIQPVQEEEINEINLDEMLARLEEASAKKDKEEDKQPAVVVNVNVAAQEKEEEKVTEPVIIEDVTKEPAKEEVEEPIKEEIKDEAAEAVKSEEKPTTIIINNFNNKEGSEFDYSVRLEKIKESKDKIERDLEKTSKSVLKYERTIRRKERNQKMLDRRALELTNLNLLMYSVTDIKNVDAEKKARQEELTAHIAELKASIQDADDYIEANKEKYESNLKLQEYLEKEKARYADEIKELKKLIADGSKN